MGVPPDEERQIIIVDVAEYLQLSRTKIYKLTRKAETPCVKFARRWRFKQEQFNLWLSEKIISVLYNYEEGAL